jgi:hypothetical protein
MTRNGKIARLPEALREQLNQRLLDGEQGKQLVLWLNELPKVQAVMKSAFEGRPITEDNLSEWKNGGYLVWASGQRMWNTVCSFMDGTKALRAAAKGGLTDRMALMLAAAMAGQMQQLESMPDGIEKAKIWRELRISLLALRRSELYAERLKIERIKHPACAKPKKRRPLTPEEEKQRIRRILGLGPGYDGSKNPELTRSPFAQDRPQSASIGPNRSESE